MPFVPLFLLVEYPISMVPVSTGYGDKLCRVIDAADPGAVPGGSTIDVGALAPAPLMGPNQDRRVFKGGVFARAE